MAFLGADTDELREVGAEFQEGKETVDQVITYLRALIVILKAAAFFSGGASAAYAQYLETTVVPWLERISQALGLFAQVLNSQAEAQDQVSSGATVNMSALPSYQSATNLPAPIQPFTGGSIVGSGAGGVATTPGGPSLGVDDNGQLVVNTGITVDGIPAAAESGPVSGGDGDKDFAIGSTAVGAEPGARVEGSALGAVGGTGAAGIASGALGAGGGTAGGAGVGSPLGVSGIDAGSEAGALSGADPAVHSGPLAEQAIGGGTPGAGALAESGSNGDAAGMPVPDEPSYGAAAGIAGGAAALGLGGAALAGRNGNGDTSEIERLAGQNGRGSSGDDVRELQERLTAAGFDTQGADGQWGSNTQAAYEAYRAEHPLEVQAGSGLTSPQGYDYGQITGVSGNPNVTPAFLREVEAMSQRLGARPEHVLAAMSFETGGEFSSDVKNPRSSATGLIQFTSATAAGLGTSTSALAGMTPIEQLSFVEQYFEPYRGRLGDLESVYTSILAGRPSSGEDALFTQGDGRYAPNRELDIDGNGVITAAEATAHVRSRMGAGSN